jgi:hypothetical protein
VAHTGLSKRVVAAGRVKQFARDKPETPLANGVRP